MTTILWHYYRDEVNDSADETDDNDNIINNTKTRKNISYRKKMTGKTPVNTSRLKAEVIVPLKYLSNFGRSLDFPLTKWEIELYSWCQKNV